MSNSRAKFVIFAVKDGKFRWKLVVRGKTVAASVTTYADKRRARQAIEAAKNNSAVAIVVDE